MDKEERPRKPGSAYGGDLIGPMVLIAVGAVLLLRNALQVSGLEVLLGVGRAARIQGVIGEVFVLVPESVAVRIRSGTGLANVRVPGDYIVMGDGDFRPPGYEEAEHRAEVWIDQAIGRVMVKPY